MTVEDDEERAMVCPGCGEITDPSRDLLSRTETGPWWHERCRWARREPKS